MTRMMRPRTRAEDNEDEDEGGAEKKNNKDADEHGYCECKAHSRKTSRTDMPETVFGLL